MKTVKEFICTLDADHKELRIAAQKARYEYEHYSMVKEKGVFWKL